jgi:hydroxymethylglutaryl-CoA synthase
MAHSRIIKDNYPGMKKSEIQANFKEKVEKSFKIPKAVGNTYSSTVYTCLMSLILDDEGLVPGDRIGIYSYGSGSCAEFYSAILLPGGKEYMKSINIDGHLNARMPLSVEQFDHLARLRSSHADKPTFETDLTYPEGWYDKYYKGKGFLTFRGSNEFRRKYEWS